MKADYILVTRLSQFFILSAVLFWTGCSKKGDTEYYPIANKCWQIENWTGLESDSMLRIDTILNIPSPYPDYVEWLSKQENHIQIRSLVSENFDDLRCLDQYLDGVRIVQLGESNHGTKEYNLMKVRLIKYLHEVHGFNVIAFESGFFDCINADRIAESFSIEEFMKNSIFSVWYTNEVLDLFYYIKYRTAHKLKLAGFDCQDLYCNNNKYNRAVLLKQYASYIDPDRAEQIYWNDVEVNHYMWIQNELIENRDLYKAKVDSAIEFFSFHYNTIIDSINSDENLFKVVLQSLKNTLTQIDKRYHYYLENHNVSFIIRDSAMAANINFLTEELYPDEKIIIWAHNAHIAYNQDHYTPYVGYNNKIMGNWLYDFYYGNDVIYTIGLYSIYGECSWAGETFPFVMPNTNKSIEAICYDTDKKYLFFDIKNHPQQSGNEWFDDIITGRIGSEGFENLYLRKEYDGIICIERSTIPDYVY